MFKVCYTEFAVQSSFVIGMRSYMQGWMCDRPLMFESYPRESICDVMRQLFALLVQDVCCETFVHGMCEVCS